MASTRTLRIVAAVAMSFSALVGTVLFLLIRGAISFQMATLMCIALIGLYFGFGVLFAVFRLISRLD